MIRGEANLEGQAQLAQPEGQAGLDGFGGEGGADCDRQIPLYGLPYDLAGRLQKGLLSAFVGTRGIVKSEVSENGTRFVW